MNRFRNRFATLVIAIIGAKLLLLTDKKPTKKQDPVLTESVRPLSGPGFAAKTDTYMPADNVGATLRQVKLSGFSDMKDEVMALKKLNEMLAKRSAAPVIVISWQAVMPDRQVFNRSFTYDRGKESAVYTIGSGPSTYYQGLTYQKISKIAASPRSTISKDLLSFRTAAPQ